MKFRSIASRIIISVVPIIAITTILFMVVIYRVTNAQINQQFNDKMRQSLETASLEIQNNLLGNADIAKSLALYAESCTLESIENGELRRYMLKIVPSRANTQGGGIWYEPYVLYSYVESFGPYVHVSGGTPVFEPLYAETVDYHSMDWYQNGRRSHGEAVWSDIYYDLVTESMNITATVPFFDGEGGLRGMATADMTLTDIQNITRSITVGDTGRAFILGADGEYISYFDDSKTTEMKIQEDPDPALAALGSQALSQKQGMTTLTLDGANYTAYFKTLSETGWILVILIDNSEIISSSMDLVVVMGTVPIIGLLLAIVSIAFVAGHLRTIVNKVNDFAGLAASGDFSKRIAIDEYDEFGIMEDRLNKMMDAMSAMHAHSQEMIDVAQRASESKSEFLSNMSHEMRTPMNAIIGMTSIAKSSPDIDQKNYCLGKIEDASTHLLGVINDILDMSKIEANKFSLSPTQFDLERVLQKVVNVLGVSVDMKHQRFFVRHDHRIPSVLVGDDHRLTQVITNLLSNAVKFTPEHGAIRLSTHLLHMADGLCTVQVEVMDTGIGVSREQQTRLFASFEQADKGISRKFGGTGLGLAISKQIVEMMGGKIWVESQLGSGSTFAFTVQLEYGQEDAAMYPGQWRHIRVLVLEHSLDVRDYYEETMRRFGIHCDFAACVEEAATLVGRNAPYDICFLDYEVPGLDIFAFADRFVCENGIREPVLVISAGEWSGIEDRAKAAGIRRFLPKPILPMALGDCINECITPQDGTADPAPDEAPDNFQGCRALLAEDMEVNREIVMALLEPTRLEVECAENGAQAVRMYSAAPARYDMIFMDIQMPEMDGYEATRTIRLLDVPGAAEVPIIAMTANAFREDIDKCLEAGMNGHLGKPLDMEELIAVLHKYLAPKPIQGQNE